MLRLALLACGLPSAIGRLLLDGIDGRLDSLQVFVTVLSACVHEVRANPRISTFWFTLRGISKGSHMRKNLHGNRIWVSDSIGAPVVAPELRRKTSRQNF